MIRDVEVRRERGEVFACMIFHPCQAWNYRRGKIKPVLPVLCTYLTLLKTIIGLGLQHLYVTTVLLQAGSLECSIIHVC